MNGFYPEQTAAFSLPIHSGIDEAKRPKFYARFVTRRQRQKIRELAKASVDLESAGKSDEAAGALDESLGMLIAGGENLPKGFTPGKASEHLDSGDCWELWEAGLNAIMVGRETLKKSVSPSPSNAGPSAADAPPAAA